MRLIERLEFDYEMNKCVLKVPYEKRSFIFNAFAQANPLIFIKEPINENMTMGILVLKYTQFFCDSENISDFIDEVLNDYIKIK